MKELLSYASLLKEKKHGVVKRSSLPLDQAPELKPGGGRKPSKRVGRGISAGQGKTCGRGHNGQKSRSGYSRRKGFEGGQTPIYRRLPKRGFHNLFSKSYEVLNLRDLERVDAQKEINPKVLAEKGLIAKSTSLVKVLGTGDAPKSMKVKVIADAFSKSAREKLEAAGANLEIRSRKAGANTAVAPEKA